MSLIRLNQSNLSFGEHVILKKEEFILQNKERVCVVGRNGTGKSTFLKILASEQELDSGVMNINSGILVKYLPQELPINQDETVFDFIASGLNDIGILIQEYEMISNELQHQVDAVKLKKLSEIQEKLEYVDGWQYDVKIKKIMSEFDLNSRVRMSELSGGMKKKVSIARILVQNPDVLLLDEPTNHLDIVTIQWLENILMQFSGSVIFISHDRGFIKNIATRIVDLDRGILSSFEGDYHYYLKKKESLLQIEEEQNYQFDKKLAKEEKWIRQGIKARRTRNEGRVRELEKLREEKQQRISRVGKIKTDILTHDISGKIVFDIQNLCYAIGSQSIVKNLTRYVTRKERIALIGRNGSGKTTLIKLLLKELQPDSGQVLQGTKLKIAYFEQLRVDLHLDKSVQDNLSDGKDTVLVNGQEKHVLGYLQDFLFSPTQARSPVSSLSGGEKNRLLLAKLFLQPANLLILDEPTNDLDMETLELLENKVIDFPGTLILVSHDREFINNCVTSSWWVDEQGEWIEYVGGYDDALKQGAGKSDTATSISSHKQNDKNAKENINNRNKQKNRLTYNQQRELQNLPKKIENLEEDIEVLQDQVSQHDFFEQDRSVTENVLQSLSQKQATLDDLYKLWEELELLSLK